MDLRRAMTWMFDDPRWYAKLGKAGAIACLPLLGPLFLSVFALQAIRAAISDDDDVELPDFRLDGQTLFTGCKCQILTLLSALAAGLLTLPLWAGSAADASSTAESSAPATALASAFGGPSYLVAIAITAVLSALLLARFALTGSAWAALDVAAIWSHLRAEPAVWIAAAVAGFAIEQAPLTLAWLLPAGVQLPAVLIATALLWPFALLVQANLIGQALRTSAQTLTRRRPLIVRVRW
jgi:hypothetical protein